MHKIANKNLIKILVAMYGVLISFFAFTNPRSVPALLIILPVVWIFGCLVLSFYLLLQGLPLIRGQTKRTTMVYAVACSAVGCLLLLLRSVDQLNARDVLLITVLSVTSVFYVSKLRQTQQAP